MSGLSTKEKILFISKNKEKINWYNTWKSELARQADTIFIGKGYPVSHSLLEFKDVVNIVIVAGLPNKGDKSKYIKDINKLTIFKVHVLFDYNIFHPKSFDAQYFGDTHYPEYRQFLIDYPFDLYFAYNSFVQKELCHLNIKLTNLTYPPEYFYEEEKEIDIISSAGTDPLFYASRKGVNRFIKGLSGVTVITKYMNFINYSNYLRKSKIFVNSGNRYLTDTVSIKYLEAMASGALVLTTKPINLDDYGFEVGEHLDIYSTFDELGEKISYYLNNEDERIRITQTAKEHVKRYTNQAVILRFLDEIRSSQTSFIRYLGSYLND